MYSFFIGIFASLEATDSTSSLPYPPVLLQFLSSSPIHPASISIFASLEVTDSTGSVPYPPVLLQFLSSSPRLQIRGEAGGSHRRHQYSPIFRRLANDNKLKTAMPRIHPLGVASC